MDVYLKHNLSNYARAPCSMRKKQISSPRSTVRPETTTMSKTPMAATTTAKMDNPAHNRSKVNSMLRVKAILS